MINNSKHRVRDYGTPLVTKIQDSKLSLAVILLYRTSKTRRSKRTPPLRSKYLRNPFMQLCRNRDIASYQNWSLVHGWECGRLTPSEKANLREAQEESFCIHQRWLLTGENQLSLAKRITSLNLSVIHHLSTSYPGRPASTLHCLMCELYNVWTQATYLLNRTDDLLNRWRTVVRHM